VADHQDYQFLIARWLGTLAGIAAAHQDCAGLCLKQLPRRDLRRGCHATKSDAFDLPVAVDGESICHTNPLCSCRRFAEWANDVKDAAEREHDASDPKIEGLRLEFGQRLLRIAGTPRDEP
jgi:hypothetical protein